MNILPEMLQANLGMGGGPLYGPAQAKGGTSALFRPPKLPPYIPLAANKPQNPGPYMQQAMQMSGVPGLMGNRQPRDVAARAQQQQQAAAPQAQPNATGYVPPNILQLLQQYGLSGAFNGSNANLGMGMPFDFSGLFR